jgi:hypothetical protein
MTFKNDTPKSCQLRSISSLVLLIGVLVYQRRHVRRLASQECALLRSRAANSSVFSDRAWSRYASAIWGWCDAHENCNRHELWLTNPTCRIAWAGRKPLRCIRIIGERATKVAPDSPAINTSTPYKAAARKHADRPPREPSLPWPSLESDHACGRFQAQRHVRL